MSPLLYFRFTGCRQKTLFSEKLISFKVVKIYVYMNLFSFQWDSGCQDCHCYIWPSVESHQSSCSSGSDQSEISGGDCRRVSLHKKHKDGLL